MHGSRQAAAVAVMADGIPDGLILRLGVFASVLAAMAIWEVAGPRRALSVSRSRRWPGNLMLVLLDALLLRLLLPAGAVGAALWAASHGIGLCHHLSWPFWVTVLVCVLLLDLVVYAQHVLFHAVPVLWRLHMVHHADRDIDVTTGLRFHPGEILLSMLIKMGAVSLLGAPVVAVIAFEVLLNAMAMFNHANARLPLALDGRLRRLLVTPDMHRVHHSVLPDEANRNFGFNLSLWDRLFGSYRAQPAAGHAGMVIGLVQYQQAGTHRLGWMLALPFRATIGPYPILRDRPEAGHE
jgi:sterol desaturase/sphingolipid hydroxylase (fatty acid hydroxylase superfamily)